MAPQWDDPLVRLRPRRVAVLVLVSGLVLTLVLTWAAATASTRNNEALLRLQVRQTAATVSAALPSAQAQIADALTVARTTGSAQTFANFVRERGLQRGVVSESLWARLPSGSEELANVGKVPLLARGQQAPAFFAHLHSSDMLSVTGILPGSPRRVGYALVSKGDPSYLVYAESALPSDKTLRVPSSSPFDDLNYALFLGRSQEPSTLIASSLPVPIGGLEASASAPFGNTYITVVGTPKAPLVSWLSSALPWIVLVAGTILSCISAATVEYVARRRENAEHLSEELATLYAQQRSIATELQHALLPAELPMIDGVEIAARYLPGSVGVDVGGDWYDVIPLEPGRFMLIVGDVSGRGIAAATVMASLRFSSRAFVSEGQSPALVVANLRKTFELGHDGCFATVLCMRVDVEAREVELANAGHLSPLVRQHGTTSVVESVLGPPIGVGLDVTTESSSFCLAPGATMLAYTDGLVERRGESLDDGMSRLQRVVTLAPEPVELLVAEAVSEMTGEGAPDDVVVIGVRWKT
jgi:serine phosphatase RsbU (regulator of sigma subunit)